MKAKLTVLALLVSSAVMANDIVPAAKQSGAVFLNDATLHTVSNGVLENRSMKSAMEAAVPVHSTENGRRCPRASSGIA